MRALPTDNRLAGPSQGVRLPRQLTTFVGREAELGEILEAFSEHRLVTLCGPGGVGKTRLAIAIAERLSPGMPDGVFLAELADVSDDRFVASYVASAAGVGERPGIGIVASLQQALATSRALLVIDNCEHLTQSCGALVHALLGACPNLRVLVTSREQLAVPGELLRRLLPLPTPATDRAAPDDLTTYDSVRLFMDRATSFLPSFALTADNAAAVSQICALTEGLPLAIELAAGRLPALSAEQVAGQLGDALAVLTTRSPLRPERQRTLRATIDWSYQRLSDTERALFNRLSVFSGPVSLETVRAVCADATLPTEEVLDTLARLIDKSLVQAEAANRELRYRLLEMLRQYASERLEEAGESLDLRGRHAEHFAALAIASSQDQERTNFPVWARRLAEDRQNVRAALSWCLVADPILALRMAGSLSWFWHTMSHLAEGRHWLEQALAAGGDDPTARARALHGAGQLVYRQGDAAAAQSFLTDALTIYRHLGDEANTARVLRALGLALLSLAAHEPAARCLEEALEVHERLGIAVDISRTTGALATVMMASARYDVAQKLQERAVGIAREIGDEWGLATSIGVMGEIALEVGDLDAARSHLQASLSLLARLTDEVSVAYRLEGFARLAAASDDGERAIVLVASASALRNRLGSVAVPHWQKRLDESMARHRRQLGAEAVAEAEARGVAMKVDEAIDYAMTAPRPADRRPARDGGAPAWASARSRAAGISAREWDVLALLMTGLSNRVIADRLSISTNTVNKHVGSILEKLEARSRSQAIAIVLGLEPTSRD